jgi:uncharacterized protein YjiS (DUF1127 family)
MKAATMSRFPHGSATTHISPRASLLLRLRHAFAMRRQRRALAALDDHMLADIGLSRSEAEAEAGLPLWDAPRHWFRCAPGDRKTIADTSCFSDGNA